MGLIVRVLFHREFANIFIFSATYEKPRLFQPDTKTLLKPTVLCHIGVICVLFFSSVQLWLFGHHTFSALEKGRRQRIARVGSIVGIVVCPEIPVQLGEEEYIAENFISLQTQEPLRRDSCYPFLYLLAQQPSF